MKTSLKSVVFIGTMVLLNACALEYAEHDRSFVQTSSTRNPHLGNWGTRAESRH
jgi:hypothetical protein